MDEIFLTQSFWPLILFLLWNNRASKVGWGGVRRLRRLRLYSNYDEKSFFFVVLMRAIHKHDKKHDGS